MTPYLFELLIGKIIGWKTIAYVLLVYTLILSLLLSSLAVISFGYRLNAIIAFPRSNERFIIVSSIAYAPYTSIISSSILEEKLSPFMDRVMVVYEVLTPVMMSDGTIYVVRGLGEKTSQKILGEYDVVEGTDLRNNCIGCIWVSREFSENHGIKPGDTIVVYSFFTRSKHLLRVMGILDISYPFSNEIITNYETARLLRGLKKDYYSIAIIFYEDPRIGSEVAEKLGIKGVGGSLLEKALIAIRFSGRRIDYSRISSIDYYMARLGLGREVFASITAGIGLVFTVGLLVIPGYVFDSLKERYIVLRTIGVDRGALKKRTALLFILLFLASLALSLMMSRILLGSINLRLLGYQVSYNIDVDVLLPVIIVGLVMQLIGLHSSGDMGDGD